VCCMPISCLLSACRPAALLANVCCTLRRVGGLQQAAREAARMYMQALGRVLYTRAVRAKGFPRCAAALAAANLSKNETVQVTQWLLSSQLAVCPARRHATRSVEWTEANKKEKQLQTKRPQRVRAFRKCQRVRGRLFRKLKAVINPLPNCSYPQRKIFTVNGLSSKTCSLILAALQTPFWLAVSAAKHAVICKRLKDQSLNKKCAKSFSTSKIKYRNILVEH
jgi:hypothetical protein